MLTLAPTVGFLAAILVLAYLADEAGVFRYAGAVAGRLSRGSPRRLLGLVFVIASVATAVLSLDATVVLLTPVVPATTTSMRMRAKPHLYACGGDGGRATPEGSFCLVPWCGSGAKSRGQRKPPSYDPCRTAPRPSSCCC